MKFSKYIIFPAIILLSLDGCTFSLLSSYGSSNSSIEANSSVTQEESSELTSIEEENSFTASKMLETIKIGWNLGNTLEAYPKKYTDWVNQGSTVYTYKKTETCWGNPLTTKDLITYVKTCGFSSVRIPVTWFDHMDSNNNIDSDFLIRVKEVVDYCVDQDLSCIINVHHDTGEKGWLFATEDQTKQTEYLGKLKTIWEQVSDYFKDYSVEKLMFEGFNEILDDSKSWNSSSAKSLEFVNTLNQAFVDTVRKSGGDNPERILIVNTYAACLTSYPLQQFKLPTDASNNRLIVQVHAYTPWTFCSGESTSWATSSIDSLISTLNSKFTSNNIPVIIGEFGVKFTDANLQASYSWVNYYMTKSHQYNIKCYLWDDGKNFKLIDRKTLSVSDSQYFTNLFSPLA